MSKYPYYTEPTHDRGTVTDDASNAARSTATSSAEGRLIVDVVDKIFLLERRDLALPYSNVWMAKRHI